MHDIYLTDLMVDSIGRRTCNSWFIYSLGRGDLDDSEVPSMSSQTEMDSLDNIPRDYDKEIHDHHNHALACE